MTIQNELTKKYFEGRINIYFDIRTNEGNYMVNKKDFEFESIIFDYIDKFRFLLSPDQLSSDFLDYSKNEILSLLFLYRNSTANMTEIADYINAPLNTATGVISRLEKKSMVERKRNSEDRRIVNIILTETAEEFIDKEKKVIQYYLQEIYKELTEEEKTAVLSIISKILAVFKNKSDTKEFKDSTNKKVRRITIE